MRRVTALLLLLLSACTTQRARQKMSFDELYSEPAPTPAGASSHPGKPAAKKPSAQEKALPVELAPSSPELRDALESFVKVARSARGQAVRGSAMPDTQVANWREMNEVLDAFLLRAVKQTAPLDVVRARVTLEAELEEDARTYGDIPGDLAEAVLARVERLVVRMAELRRLQFKPSPSKRRLVFAWPVDPVVITSVFGSRVHPITHEEREHQGLDLAARLGQPVQAAAAGTVVRAGWNGSHGNQVVLEHARGVTTRYSHLSRILVEPGEELQQGDVLGEAGKTGLATGVHVHFEVWREGEPCDPLDELGPTESGEEPAFVHHEQEHEEKQKGRRPVGRRPSSEVGARSRAPRTTASSSAPWRDGSRPSSTP